jgi:4-hydroxybenzoate polyprenyltransferase
MNRNGRIGAWLQLFRLPNLFTVPAEPVAGFFLAAASAARQWHAVLPVLLATLCFYAGGTAWNDYFDRRRDYHTRPQRPLPSGRIRPGAALTAGWLLMLGGGALCLYVSLTTAAIGGALVLVILSYNRYLKKVAVLGVLNMGLCRGLSLVLGASALPVPDPYNINVWIAAIIVTLYTAAVTQTAKREAVPHNPTLEIWLPFSVLLVGAFLFIPLAQKTSALFFVTLLLSLAIPLLFGIRLQSFVVTANLPRTLKKKQDIVQELPQWIGGLIAHLLIISAMFTLSTGAAEISSWAAAALLTAWLLNRLVARWFYAS